MTALDTHDYPSGESESVHSPLQDCAFRSAPPADSPGRVLSLDQRQARDLTDSSPQSSKDAGWGHGAGHSHADIDAPHGEPGMVLGDPSSLRCPHLTDDGTCSHECGLDYYARKQAGEGFHAAVAVGSLIAAVVLISLAVIFG